MIERRVVRDLEDPRAELVAGIVAIERVEHLDEGVLGEVFRLLAIADQAVDERKDRTLVAPDQFSIRRLAALPGEDDDFLVGQFFIVHCGRTVNRASVPDYGASLRPVSMANEQFTR